MKLKYPNIILQDYPKPDVIPNFNELVYTQVLTKQSALFNSWKEMNRVSNDEKVPFRCVAQWATYQTGKLKETLGLPLLPLNALTQASQSSGPNAGAPLIPASASSGSEFAPVRKRVLRKKESNVLLLG